MSKVNKLLASPPKKHSTSHPSNPPTLSGQSEPHTTATLAPTPPGTNSQTPPPRSLTTSNLVAQQAQLAMNPFCQQVEEAFQKQNAVNESFTIRINHLEEITRGLDQKVDQVLECLAPTSRKAQQTSKNMHCEDVEVHPTSTSFSSNGVHSDHVY